MTLVSDDYGVVTQPRFTAAELRRAQLNVCANATDSEEALELLEMLGLIGHDPLPTVPEPDGKCIRCGSPCVHVDGGRGVPIGMRAFAKHGFCRPCYRGTGVARA